ncbi:MAG: polyphosphate polymerase domain-containing protein [Flavobacteriales bacterium]
METIQPILSQFEPIDLSEMDGVELMNRTDTKFMISVDVLAAILPDLFGQYRILEVAGNRQSRYETLYYDTPDFKHYLQHQNGKRNRFKIRKRQYVDSALSFLEVKFKNNKGRTVKSRIRLKDWSTELDERGYSFIEDKVKCSEGLEPKLWNAYNRITLVDTVHGERVTFDGDMSFYFGERICSMPSLVIAEVKQDGENRHSRFMQHMKKGLLRPEGISKYCLGVALLYPEIKSNTFKDKILRINKITATL